MASEAACSDSPSCSGAVAASATNQAAFICQRCLQPLNLNQDFHALSEHTLAELQLPISPSPDADLDAAADIPMSKEEADLRGLKVDSVVSPLKLNASTVQNQYHSGFTLINGNEDRTASPSFQTLSHRLAVNARLFNLMSSNNTSIDHPLCEECTNTILDALDQQLKVAEEEAQAYQTYLQKLENEKDDGGASLEALEKEFSELQCQEKELQEELASLEVEQEQVEKKLKEELQVKEELLQREEKYWKQYSKFKLELLTAEDEYLSLDCKIRYAQSQLDKLGRTNVFNATFHIWHVGPFATINGLRLGRLSSNPVEWSEINAAWGDTALLLSCLAQAIGLHEFQRYKLVPYGNYSYMKNLADDKVLPLYGTGGFRMMFETKFDQAMVAFLDCLQQFAAETEKNEFSLPYEMDKGKIRDNSNGQYYSIKLQFNSDEAWTRALRYMLTNLKWGLAYVSTKYAARHEKPDSMEQHT